MAEVLLSCITVSRKSSVHTLYPPALLLPGPFISPPSPFLSLLFSSLHSPLLRFALHSPLLFSFSSLHLLYPPFQFLLFLFLLALPFLFSTFLSFVLRFPSFAFLTPCFLFSPWSTYSSSSSSRVLYLILSFSPKRPPTSSAPLLWFCFSSFLVRLPLM